MPPATDLQQMEIEMVEGMYPDAFELLSEDPPTYSVVLSASEEEPPELKVTVTYTSEDYPESAASVLVAESIAKNRRIQTGALLKELQAIAEENIGMHSTIAVLQRAQEYLTDFHADQAKQDLQRRGDAMNAAAAPTAVDPTIRIGCAVTKELFAEWSVAHLAEKRALRAAEERRLKKESASKLTGRQLWDGTLKNADWDLFGGEEDGQDIEFEKYTGIVEDDDDQYDLDD